MTNEEYQTVLAPYLTEMEALRKYGHQLGAGIIGETLCEEDLFFCAALDRCIQLSKGLAAMLCERNLTCAGAMLRMQLDNCMRTYAAFIAADRHAVVQCIINGEQINKQKDKNGTRMSDGHLKDELTQYDSQFATVYDAACGYIHLSEKAFYGMLDSVDDGAIAFHVGSPLHERRNPVLIECVQAFIHFVKLHYKLLDAVVDSKRRVDAQPYGE